MIECVAFRTDGTDNADFYGNALKAINYVNCFKSGPFNGFRKIHINFVLQMQIEGLSLHRFSARGIAQSG